MCESFRENGASKGLIDIVIEANRKMAERYQGYTAEISSITLTKACFFGKTRRGNVNLNRNFQIDSTIVTGNGYKPVKK